MQALPVTAVTLNQPEVRSLPLASSVSAGYVKGPVAYSTAGSHDSDGGLIPAGNRQQLQADHSRSSIAASLA